MSDRRGIFRSTTRGAAGVATLAAALILSSVNAFAAVGQPTVTVQPTDQSVTSGASATFTSDASGTPAPTVQWQVSIGGGPYTDVAGATSTTLTIPTTNVAMSGSSYQAVFTNSAGSATSNAAMLVVNKASPTIATLATPSALPGGAISDTATLAGGNAPGGTITFDVYDPGNPTCSGNSTFQSIKQVAGDGPYTSDPLPAVLLGVYRWIASYSGDADNNAVMTACNDANETSTVAKATLVMTTQATLTASSGGTISDTAALTGDTVPTGTISFSLFGPDDPTCLGPAIVTSTTPVFANGNNISQPYTADVPGTYRWVAAYSGDANNNPATTLCGDPLESSVVTKATTFITTVATASANTGGLISDIATLSGGNAPTGTITFTLYGPNDPTCAGIVPFTSTRPASGNNDYQSGSFSPQVAGAYRWVAGYSGDANNNAVSTACNDPSETTTVRKFSVTLGTAATASVPLGGTISDDAVLSGGNAPTGTVSFSLFGPTDPTCSGVPLFKSSKDVIGNGRYTSDLFTPLTPGAYRWVVAYSGDANNYPAAGACDDQNETSTVLKASPTITTLATVSANIGGAISDTASLAGGNAATGTITFTLYGPNDATCSGVVASTSTAAVNGDGTYPSSAFTAALSGTYRWVAVYGGDANNNAVSTACNDTGETTTVTKASPTITTLATVSANAGGAISDTATLAGGNVPTGTITFSLYGPNDATCSGIVASTSTAAVNGDGPYPSSPFAAALSGTYRWVAAYGGDANNNAASTACNDTGETSTVTKASPTIITQATTSASTGGAISDTAILAGGNAATGTITFTLYGPNDATCSGIVASTSTAAVTGDGTYLSGPFTAALSGAYNWVAAYGGDPNNNAVSTACNDTGETSTVTKASPTISTVATVSANAGGAISDTAILAGGNVPTGSITFTLYGPNDATCSGIAASTSTTAVNGDGTYSSSAFTAALSGAYNWVAMYGGDANNNATSTLCNDNAETSTVTKASPTITTVATASANTGGAIADTATLAGGNVPTGTITFTLYGPNDATCSGIVAFTSTKTVASGNGAYPSDPFTPTLPGTYTWIASYSGDGGNNPATTACNDAGETSTVSAASSQDVKLTLFSEEGFKSGEVGEYIAIITNTGTTATSGTLTFTDTFPTGVTYVGSFSFRWTCSVSGQTLTCTYANSLAPHRSTALVLFVRVTAPAGTVITNTATLAPSDATPDDNTASATVTVASSDEQDGDSWSHDHAGLMSTGPRSQSCSGAV